MVTKLAELAIVVSLVTLSQRLVGYENKPLGYLLLVIALIAAIFWLRDLIGEFAAKKHNDPKTIGRTRKTATIIAGAALICFVAYPWLFARREAALPSPPQDTAIFMECDTAGLPLTVPAGETLPVIPVNQKQIRTQHWGFFEVSGNPSDKNGTWPDKALLDKSSKLHNPGVFGYKCRVSNHGPANLIYLGVPIDITFGNTNKGEKALRYTPVISALDAGKQFEFYIFNDCDVAAFLIWQDTARVQLLGEPTQRDVPLHRTYKSPIDQVMILMPTKVRWAMQYPTCE
jgi:hypothetical protein